MDNVSIIGIDISKSSFQVRGATSSGEPVLRKKLSRGKVLEFLASQPPCLVVMETCGGAHHWGREIQPLGHEVRLIAPIYVKAFAKRHKSDARDAAAIVEAAQRPTMRFVAVKPAQVQARSMVFRTRALLVRQRTQTVNALRGHLPEFGRRSRARHSNGSPRCMRWRNRSVVSRPSGVSRYARLRPSRCSMTWNTGCAANCLGSRPRHRWRAPCGMRSRA